MSKLEQVGAWLKKHARCLKDSCRDGKDCIVVDCMWVGLLNILEGRGE